MRHNARYVGAKYGTCRQVDSVLLDFGGFLPNLRELLSIKL